MSSSSSSMASSIDSEASSVFSSRATLEEVSFVEVKAHSDAPPLQTSPITLADCAVKFQIQGIRHEPVTNQLWCALCTVGKPASQAYESKEASANGPVRERDKKSRTSTDAVANTTDEHIPLPPLADVLCLIGTRESDVLAHCATRDHLRRFEKARLGDLQHWCPVELDGQRMLLDHHCLYPSQMFGPGRMLMDETIAGGVLLAQDVCGGVKLWPRHCYSVVELVLPPAQSFVKRVVVEDEEEGTDGLSPPQLRPHGTESGEDATPAVQEHSGEATNTQPRATRKRCLDIFYEEAGLIRLPEEELIARNTTRERNISTTHVKQLPSFYRQRHGVRSRRVEASDVAQVLRDVNGFIRGEMAYRKARVEKFAKMNL